ncbi:MAG: aminotransferase class V-fold PLP-dependent enzyme, partial [Pirellulaceae bacterium]
MNSSHRVYLDNAATSWPKPETVYEAVEHYQRNLGAPAGRSAYREAADVERQIRDARKRVAQLINARRAEQVVFTNNGTDSLNQAIHGVLRPGDHVVTTVVEHNSVLRPLRQLEMDHGVEVTRVPCDGLSLVDPQEIRKALRTNTRLIAMIHASNVTGSLQAVDEVAQLAKHHGALFLVDAAQSLGHVPIDVQAWGVDLLAAPGHKGLLGPLGTGVLYIAPGLEKQVRPIRQGGTGTDSGNDRQPDSMPDRFETGNHNVPGILGLRAGVAFIAERGLDQIREHEMTLTAQLIEGLAAIEGIRVLGPIDMSQRVGVVSITARGYDPHEVATMLDAVQSIQVRSGLHCAPRVHESLGTILLGGAIRFSLGPFNSSSDIESATG